MDTKNIYANTYPSKFHHFLSLHHPQRSKKSLFAILSLLLLLLLAYNGVSLFCLDVTKFSSSLMYAPKVENQPSIPTTRLSLLKNSRTWVLFKNGSSIHKPKQRQKQRPTVFKFLGSKARTEQFSARVKEFFDEKLSNSSCNVKFFMTWISSLESFGERELFTIESLFKSHPNGCLIIVSDSMDSRGGLQLLRPFSDKGFRVTSISPDFDYLLKNTVAESWFDRLKKGDVNPGWVSLGQNLSNLLRLALLYKFGGVYIDTDVIILKSFAPLRNSIGAQTVDVETGNWSRLNNAVMIFDQGHPLVYMFIEEFALTFNGNLWGHNGPYLVSRVVSRVKTRPGCDFNVLPPTAFYPVGWTVIRTLFVGGTANDEAHSKWLNAKLTQIRGQSFAVHLWNRQSRELKVEEGSVIGHIMQDCCVLCNSSASTF
ncbi:uncharacterized protein LOC132281473 [Cornus florida]|uniref:uncharacterized protein LOC132281473 n=1 Tax=Cornus florida TaxID=4283 RepID=UPI00289F969E|nr:uncharacterized protein LOC132281473 [Cornus florida]